jgi:hypothetical protein
MARMTQAPVSHNPNFEHLRGQLPTPCARARLDRLARPGTLDPILATQHSGAIDVTRLRPVAVLEARESDTFSDQRGGVRTGRRATFMVRDETIVSLPFSKYVAPDVRHGSFADFRFGSFADIIAATGLVRFVPEVTYAALCRPRKRIL